MYFGECSTIVYANVKRARSFWFTARLLAPYDYRPSNTTTNRDEDICSMKVKSWAAVNALSVASISLQRKKEKIINEKIGKRMG